MRSPVFYSLTCLGSFIFLVACKTKQIQSDPPSATSSSLLPLEVTSLESYIPSDKLFSLVATEFGEKTLDVEAEFTAFC